MERTYLHGNSLLPTWVISPDCDLVKDIERGLQTNSTLCFKGYFPKWHAAIRHFKDSYTKVVQPSSGEAATHVVIVDDHSEALEGLNWLAILKDTVPTVLISVLMHDPNDERIATALSTGVSALLAKPCPASQILSAVAATLEGVFAVSPSIMNSIAHVGDAGLLAEWQSLTKREKEVLSFLASGYSVKEIADALFISFYTAETHVRNIHKKLTVRRSSSLVVRALRNRLPLMNYSC